MQKKYRKTEKPLLYTIIKHKFLFLLIVTIIGITIFIFFPRNLKNLLVHNNNTTTIGIVKTADDKQEAHDIPLNENQKAALLELFENSYVRLKVFHKEYVNKNFMGYLIMLPDTLDTVCFFTTDIISINGTQYKVYGNKLADKFKSIIESEE